MHANLSVPNVMMFLFRSAQSPELPANQTPLLSEAHEANV